MELRFGDISEARKIYRKAVQCSTDSPQTIIQRFLNFESVHGATNDSVVILRMLHFFNDAFLFLLAISLAYFSI